MPLQMHTPPPDADEEVDEEVDEGDAVWAAWMADKFTDHPHVIVRDLARVFAAVLRLRPIRVDVSASHERWSHRLAEQFHGRDVPAAALAKSTRYGANLNDAMYRSHGPTGDVDRASRNALLVLSAQRDVALQAPFSTRRGMRRQPPLASAAASPRRRPPG